jgi:hypothetical protein
MRFNRSARVSSGLCSLLLLAACGGGGGADADPPSVFNPPPPPTSQQPPSSSPQPLPPWGPEQNPPSTEPPVMPSGTVSFETNAVSFATSTRFVTPLEQTIAVMLDGVPDGTVDHRVRLSGNAVAFAEVLFADGTASLRIVPRDAKALDIGVNTGTITVSICIDDPSCGKGLMVGQPQTINVTYTVTASVQGDVVSPRVAAANQPGNVVIRGRGFTDATSVRFGGVAASAMTVVNDSEIRAAYPALAAGRYPVSINSGSIAFTGAVTAVNVPDYAAATLAYPSTPRSVNALLYDPERNTLLVAAQYEQRENDQLIRFTYSAGQWSAPVSSPVPFIEDLAFSPDGSTLLVATEQALTEYDPATLAAGASYALPTAAARLRSLAVANDGYAIVAADTLDSGGLILYAYSTQDHTFTGLNEEYRSDYTIDVVAGASASGSYVTLVPSIRLTTLNLPTISASLYDASAQRLYSLANVPHAGGRASARPALDRAGSLSVLHATLGPAAGGTAVVVYDNKTQQQLGRLPNSTGATFLNSDATRAYALSLRGVSLSDANELRTYDLTQPPAAVDAEYPQIGAGLPLSLQRGSGPFAIMATSDVSTLFLAGGSGLVVQPTPQ